VSTTLKSAAFSALYVHSAPVAPPWHSGAPAPHALSIVKIDLSAAFLMQVDVAGSDGGGPQLPSGTFPLKSFATHLS
jgi:hypothetical protein